MGSGGGGSGVDKVYNSRMADLAERMAGMGDVYSAIDLTGYRPGGTASRQYNSYNNDVANSKTIGTTTGDVSASDARGMSQVNDPNLFATELFTDGKGNYFSSSGQNMNNSTVVKNLTQLNGGKQLSYANQNDPGPGGRTVSGKVGGAATLRGAGADAAVYQPEVAGKGGGGNYDGAANSRMSKYGGMSYDENGDSIYRSQSGQRYNASAQGLQQAGIDSMLSIVEPTRDLEYDNIQSQRRVMPSSERATIATNDLTGEKANSEKRLLGLAENTAASQYNLTTDQNDSSRSLLPGKTSAERAGYGFQEARYNTDTNLEGDRELSTRLGYGAQDSLNRSTVNQGASRDFAAISANNLSTDQNESARRLVGDTEAANRSGLRYQTSQNESDARLIPQTENARMADLQYKTDYSRGATALLPKRFEATGKFIDESMRGRDVNAAMDEAGVDVSRAFNNADAANRRNMARMGVAPNAARLNSSRLDSTKALIGARALAKRNTMDDNYRKLGAAALMQ